MDAARVGVAQVDRDIDRGRDLHRAAVGVGDPHRQRDPLHADPVQRPRQRGGVVGDVGQRQGESRVRDTAAGGRLNRRAL